MGQTVNLLSLDFGGSNPSAPTNFKYHSKIADLLLDANVSYFAIRRNQKLRDFFC